jgi:hypothetical protein
LDAATDRFREIAAHEGQQRSKESMKLVNSLEILGNPNRVDEQVACPGCSARAMLFEDGSVLCVAEGGKCYAPESTDGDKWKMRQEYDAKNGITPSDRLLIPAQLQRELGDRK